jgi:hypothetical protein
MENLLTAEVWQNPPGMPNTQTNGTTGYPKGAAGHSIRIEPHTQKRNVRNEWSKPLPILRHQSNDSRRQVAAQSLTELRQQRDSPVNAEEHSTASTQSTTQASESQYLTKFRELEALTKRKLNALAETCRDSTDRLKQLEKQFERFGEMDQKVSAVQNDVQLVARHLEDSIGSQQGISDNLIVFQAKSQQQFDELGSHLLTAVGNVNTLSGAMSDIKAEVTKLTKFIQELAYRQQANGFPHT